MLSSTKIVVFRAFGCAFPVLFMMIAACQGQGNPSQQDPSGEGKNNAAQWEHLSTVNGDLPVPNKGNQQTATLVIDVDKDGVNDFIITERTEAPSAVWYRRVEDGWDRYVIEDEALTIEAGSAFCDIDGDGDLDIVFGGDSQSNQLWWWENPYPDYAPDKPWTRRLIKDSGANKHHDQLFGDFDGDGKEELVFWNQGGSMLFFAKIPADPKQAGAWECEPIYQWSADSEMEQRGTYPKWRRTNEHEGLAKIDIDGDGKLDILGGGRWFKHVEGKKFLPNIIDASYQFTRSAAGDFIEGGRPEVILSAGDGTAPMVMYEWQEGVWKSKVLIEGMIDGHSIGVLDFNGDGHLDIFTAEMQLGENPAPKTRILLGDGQGNFEELLIHSGFGLHEAVMADLTGDGLPDILGKPYTWEAPRLDIWINKGEINQDGNERSGSSLDNWKYIGVDNQRAKWGDFDDPAFLRYFGLDMMDITGNGFKDIVAGRYFYRNPGGDMTGSWSRVDLGMNADGMLFTEVGNDTYGGIIATALPDVYWFRALDGQGDAWEGIKIGELPPTTHVNGQGYAKAQIVPGGNQEILLATGKGIYYFEIPQTDPQKGNWPVTHAAPEASDEGFGVGDIDGDGLLDIAAGRRQGEDEGNGMEILWWKNPGNGEGNWKNYTLGKTAFDADRIAVADINGNGKADIVVSEERYPGPDPDASLFWFEQPADPAQKNWERHTVVTQYSLNNLDVADMDGDGHHDIITAEHKGPELKLQIWKNDGEGNFTENLVDRGKESHLGARVADLNGNGALDIISIGWDQHQYLHVWRNDDLAGKSK